MNFKLLLSFLKDLSENNHKEWFDDNRKTYENLRKEWLQFAADAIKEVGKFDKEIASLEPKQCIFRINRDIRFSKDKSPYKTNFGLSLSKGGKRDDFCGYYLHVQPGASFLAGGSYMPMPAKLAAIRQEIDYNADEFLGIVENKKFKALFGKLSGETLQRPPKGYEAENPMLAYLKHKSFIAEYKLSDKELLKPDFDKKLIEVFAGMLPLNNFLYRAMEG
ncbi:MAG: DUF2461 domain-containing protein [Bacteroidia bacterium]|nr:DUF2461 domain-containing protein [Bacteroidia bacterium]